MGILSNKLRQGTIQKCINQYLKDIPDHAKFLINVHNYSRHQALVISHIHRARQYFNDLEVFLLYKERINPQELGDHLLIAEKMALEKASNVLKISFDDVFEEIINNANLFASSSFDGTPVERLIPALRGGAGMSGKSSLWRQLVISEILALSESNELSKSAKSSSKFNSPKPIIEIVNSKLVKKPGTAKKSKKSVTKPQKRKPKSNNKAEMRKHFDSKNVINLSEFQKQKKNRSKMAEREIVLADEPAYLLSIPKAGWSWYCDFHEAFGVADTEHEALWMGGAHMHYFEEQGDDCEMFVRDW